MTHQDAEEFGHAPNEPHDPQGKPTMSEKMKVTFYRKELTWFGYEVEVEAKSNQEAMEKIKDYDYVQLDITDEECDSEEGYGVFYFPDGTEIDESEQESDNE